MWWMLLEILFWMFTRLPYPLIKIEHFHYSDERPKSCNFFATLFPSGVSGRSKYLDPRFIFIFRYIIIIRGFFLFLSPPENLLTSEGFASPLCKKHDQPPRESAPGLWINSCVAVGHLSSAPCGYWILLRSINHPTSSASSSLTDPVTAHHHRSRRRSPQTSRRLCFIIIYYARLCTLFASANQNDAFGLRFTAR